jgi:FAD synthetase
MPGSRKGKGRKKAGGRSKRPVVVMATGVFDILHTGHIFFLTEARKLGDELVVVVARDATAKRLKREPIVPELLRLELVRGLKPVDRAVLGDVGDQYRVVEEIKPDIIALGHDQVHDEEKIRKALAQRGLVVRVVRLPVMKHDLLATRRIIDRIIKAYEEHKAGIGCPPGAGEDGVLEEDRSGGSGGGGAGRGGEGP